MEAHNPPQSLDVLGIPSFVQEAMTKFIVQRLALCQF